MKTIKYMGLDCVPLENEAISLLVTQSVGPRVISLRFKDGPNLFAELPQLVTKHADGTPYNFYGGHRLWHSPEVLPRTYMPEDDAIDIIQTPNGLVAPRPADPQTGIEKTIQLTIDPKKAQVTVRHVLTNRGVWPMDCAPWAITQLRPGGVAILPQSLEQPQFLANRSLAIWPYADLTSPHLTLGSRYIQVRSKMDSPFKIGYPNPRGWQAYWLEGTLFVKKAVFNPQATYYDYGSSSECYCNASFIELETLGPIVKFEPGQSVEHTETWELYAGIEYPENETVIQKIVDRLGLN